MFEVHISKHSLFRLKITVGCRLCTYPSIHFSLDEDTLKIPVGCLVCACGVCGVWVVCVHVVLCVVLVVCVLLCCGGAYVWCVVKLGTLSLLLSSLLSFVSSSYLYFSLFFFFFFFSCSFSCSCSCYFSFSSLSPLLATNQPTRRPTSRH